MRARSNSACAPRAVASARSRSAAEDACCCASSLVRARAWSARSRCAASCATWAWSCASSTLKSGVPFSTSCPSRTRKSVIRPSTSGRRSMDCTASICPVAATSSRTVSTRATATSTGSPANPPPPAPLVPPFLQAPVARAAATAAAAAVPALLHPEVLARYRQSVDRQHGAGTRRHVTVVRRRHVVLHGAVHILADRPRHVPVDPRLRQRDLALRVVPQRERDAEGQGGKRPLRRGEGIAEAGPRERQRGLRQVGPELGAKYRRGRPLVGRRLPVTRPLGRGVSDCVGQ